MSAIQREIEDQVRKWMQFGDEDLQYAIHGLSIEGGIAYRLVAYLAQQSAEKYLKSYLVYHRVDFPRTHNISILLELCPEKDTWPESLDDAEKLSPYAVNTRYPGEAEPVTEFEARESIVIAERVRNVIRSILSKSMILNDCQSDLK